MSATGPFYLRSRQGGGPAPVLQQFATLDDALDAVEARWETLQHEAPQILDGRKVLLVSTDELVRMMAEEDEPA